MEYERVWALREMGYKGVDCNPNHILHTILTDDQCRYWRLNPPTNLSLLLEGLKHSTHSHTPYQPWKPSNVSFFSTIPPPQTTVLYYIPSTTENRRVIHVASRTHTMSPARDKRLPSVLNRALSWIETRFRQRQV